ncbi:thiaminase II [Kingella negevensis]|uniref:Aminopyrimidine aminohydrolase n=1 Tax=Kingella negevensis TaxID=1522312 RepID=A0A238HGA9_9NEIS|nr:thiaminase II [Kingella negevensis]MDK4684877.1 thiaminase II [Kingella negevensis]MDK4698210.1 thiaminase II [Kingella negevensis]MDK4707763.1 thiaminase II [Kingella negevensis]MDK4709286.1 thiaminase II [Kingella negevensis]SNB65520.1 Thiaminase-2 [Kingella negevensis]
MLFSKDVWQRNEALYQETLNLPFNQELAQGTLAQDAFCHYVIQDAHYLEAYGRALSVCAAKAFDANGILQFSQFAQGAVAVERQLHGGFMQQFGISAEQFANTPLTEASHHYTSYLLATAWSESYPVVLASLLPCFWIYAEVGSAIYHQSVPNNPYQAWIDTYAGDEFHQSVRKAIDLIDDVASRVDAETLAKMHIAYTTSAKLEWLFWDSAYQQREWRVQAA